MSLYEPADGILETHVTWEDIEKDMQFSFGTNATFGENKRATNISDLKGYMSRIALIEADWIGAEEKEKLPQKFAVKISSQIPLFTISKILKFDGDKGFSDDKMKQLGKLTRECHNREVETYKLLMKFNHPDIPFTKVHGFKKFTSHDDLKGYLILDFVENVHTVGMYKSIPADDLVSLVRGIATFAALGETLSVEEKQFAGGPEYLELAFGEIFEKASLEKTFESLYQVFSEEHHNKVDKLIEVFGVYQSILNKYSKISETLGFKLVLNHGDLWQSNMIHTLDKDGKLRLEAMIDWQSTSSLPPGLDTSRLMLGCFSARDRRERGMEFLKLYYDTFTKVLGREHFKFQELLDSYNLYFPMAAMLIVPGMMPFIENSQLPEKEKEEVKKEALLKITAIMEDVIDIHGYNVEKYPDFMKMPNLE
ncbi:unnamed protein product [Caenorhabditis brenneri]